MSRTTTGWPEFRLRFSYPHLQFEQLGAPPGRVAFDPGNPALRGFAAEIARVGGRLSAELPEAEVWRGRVAVADRRTAERRAAAAAALGGRPGSGAGDAAARATARPSVVVRLRTRVKGAHVARALRLQMQRRPCLSGERRLARQVDRYHAVLESIRRDYG